MKRWTCSAFFALTLFLVVRRAVAKTDMEAARYTIPDFVKFPLFPNGRANVFEIVRHAELDLVFITGGWNEGFRVGMMCDVFNDDKIFAQLILVEVRLNRSVGLIVAIMAENYIEFGNRVKIRTVKFLN